MALLIVTVNTKKNQCCYHFPLACYHWQPFIRIHTLQKLKVKTLWKDTEQETGEMRQLFLVPPVFDKIPNSSLIVAPYFWLYFEGFPPPRPNQLRYKGPTFDDKVGETKSDPLLIQSRKKKKGQNGRQPGTQEEQCKKMYGKQMSFPWLVASIWTGGSRKENYPEIPHENQDVTSGTSKLSLNGSINIKSRQKKSLKS